MESKVFLKCHLATFLIMLCEKGMLKMNKFIFINTMSFMQRVMYWQFCRDGDADHNCCCLSFPLQNLHLFAYNLNNHTFVKIKKICVKKICLSYVQLFPNLGKDSLCRKIRKQKSLKLFTFLLPKRIKARPFGHKLNYLYLDREVAAYYTTCLLRRGHEHLPKCCQIVNIWKKSADFLEQVKF